MPIKLQDPEKRATMHVQVTDEHGAVLAQRALGNAEMLDCDVYAAEFVASFFDEGQTFETANTSGDFRVVLLPDPNNTTHIYTAQWYLLGFE